MKYLASVISTLAITAGLIACGESYLIDESEQPTLRQHTFVLPDRFTGQPYNYTSPVTTVYLDTNESVKFWAAYSIDWQYIPSDSAESHFLSHSWTIENENYNISPLRYKFPTPGFRRAILETVDILNDTLRDTVNIFVNTPVSIGIVAPVNGFNRVNPGQNSSVQLLWTLDGLDSWEKSVCYVYAAYEKQEVWRNALGKVNCSEGAVLNGSFLGDSLTQYIMEHPESDTSVTVYWGVKAILYTEDGFEERDSTEIHQFSTLFMHGDSSTISIPIVYDNLRNNRSIHTKILITNSAGDTLDLQNSRTSPTTITSKIAAQTGVHIHVYDVSKNEFEAEDITISTSPGALTLVDTIHMQDKIQPQVAVLNSAIGFSDSSVFYVLDNGAGINPNRIYVSMDSDTLDFNYEEPFIKFKCTIRISVEDYARNANSRVFWKMTPSRGFLDSLFIKGPYTDISGDP